MHISHDPHTHIEHRHGEVDHEREQDCPGDEDFGDIQRGDGQVTPSPAPTPTPTPTPPPKNPPSPTE